MIPFCGHYICWYANLRDILFTKDVDWDQLLLCTGTTFLFNASVSAWKFFPCTTYIRGSSGYSKKLSPVITDQFTHPCHVFYGIPTHLGPLVAVFLFWGNSIICTSLINSLPYQASKVNKHHQLDLCCDGHSLFWMDHYCHQIYKLQ